MASAMANAPPAAPPAIAATGGLSFFGRAAAEAWDAEVGVVVEVIVTNVLAPAPDAVVDDLALLELAPPLAPYCLLRSSVPRNAGTRLSTSQVPGYLHGFVPVLQHPMKTGFVLLHV